MMWIIAVCLSMQISNKVFDPPPNGAPAVWLIRWPWLDDYDGSWILEPKRYHLIQGGR